MTETTLNRIVNSIRGVPRELIQQLEVALSIRGGANFVSTKIEAIVEGASGTAIRDLRDTLRDCNFSDAAVIAARSALLTRARAAYTSPKAVCTLPGIQISGIEETVKETIRLVSGATHSIYLMSYWMTAGSKAILDSVMERVRENDSLNVVLIGDSRERFLKPLEGMWDRKLPRPAVYIFRPGLLPGEADRVKMHAKTLVVDERAVLVTSANMTKLAGSDNIEVGISLEAPRTAQKFAQMMSQLIHREDLFERAW